MTQSIGTIREFHTRNFKVIVDALPEDDLDLSFDETGEVARKLDNGTFIAFVARARVLFHGSIVGTDYLGGCIYESLDAFQDHRECGKQNRKWERQGKTGRCGSYFHDMIREACAEARKHVRDFKAIRVRGGQS
jgi:hypothetical protein